MNTILSRNLQALSLRDPALRDLLLSVRAAPGLSTRKARSGALIPFLAGSGRPLPLHSTFDPEKEGARLREEYPAAGFCVFLGLGAGFHIFPFARDPDVSAIVVVERDPGVLRSILETLDLSSLLRDERFRLLLDPGPGVMERILLSEYLPALMGNLVCVPLRSRARLDAEFFSGVAREIESAASRLGADYAAQARFGKRWFLNALLNLPFAEESPDSLGAERSVLVAGAGPSLDLYADSIRENARDRFLISTDTALPALLLRGIRPDLAISIDCQHYGYLHALAGAAAGVPFLFDLTSPPSLVRNAVIRGFFAGGHPLCRYMRRHWKPFLSLDTSGGNVSHAAVSLAGALGAREILLYGMDFSYPDAKAYAKGTYLSEFFGSNSSRLSPLDSSFFSLIFGKGDVQREPIDEGWRYTTPLMLSYRQNMQRLLGGMTASISCFQGRGFSLRPADSPQAPVTAFSVESSSFARKASSWRVFLNGYRKVLLELPEPSRPIPGYLRGLPPHQKELWSTLLPLVPYLESRSCAGEGRLRLLSDSRVWALERIGRVLVL